MPASVWVHAHFTMPCDNWAPTPAISGCTLSVSPMNCTGTITPRKARFINSGLKATLTGGIVSDGLENGQVISGVGGQYNFVAMAHALPDARSILTIKSTRGQGGSMESNIVWNYGHITIPRHLRD